MSRSTTTWIFAALAVAYFFAHFAVRVPDILDSHVSHGGMVNWYGSVRSADADQADGDLEVFKRKTGLRGSSPGFNVVRAAMRVVGDPVQLGKAWAWVLLGAALVFLWKIAVRLGGPSAGLLACVMFMHMPGLPLTLSGIPHNYAWPLLLAFVWFQETQRPWATIACVVLAGLFYPPLALLCCLLFVVRRTRRHRGRLQLPVRDREVWILSGAMVLTLLVIFPWKLLLAPQEQVSWLSYEGRFARDAVMERGDELPPANQPVDEVELPFESVLEIVAHDIMDAAGQPLMSSGDRLLPLPLVWSFRLAPALLALLALGMALVGGRELARPPRLVAELLLASVGLYLLAVLCALYLFVPDRYLLYSLPVASALYLAVLVTRAAERVPGRVGQGIAPVLAVLYLVGWGTGIDRHSEWTDDFSEAAGVLGYLEGTPADTVVAGPLVLMDAVELFADRETQVLSQEVLSTTDALDGQAFVNLRTRVTALHAAYYTERPEVALQFMERFGVDLLVVQDWMYETERLEDVHGSCELPQVLAEPLTERGAVFALPGLDDAVTVYADEEYRVVSREQLARHLRSP